MTIYKKWKRLMKALVTSVILRLSCIELPMGAILYSLCLCRVRKNLMLSGFVKATIWNGSDA